MQRIEDMKKEMRKKDAGTIFNPVMYLMILILTAQLLVLFVEYKRVAWLSGCVTNAMTDALLGACTLNEEELLKFGSSDELEILYPEEKYNTFRDILREELGLTADMQAGEKSAPFIQGEIEIKDFKVYSVCRNDLTVYDFDEAADCTVTRLEDEAGTFTADNGKVIEETTLVAEIGFTVQFLGVPVEVTKYHMVDVAKHAGR